MTPFDPAPARAARSALLLFLLLCAAARGQLAPPPLVGPGGGLTVSGDPEGTRDPDVLVSEGPEYTLWFSLNAAAPTHDFGALADGTPTPLGMLYGTNVARFTPGRDTTAVKVHSSPELTVIVGDADYDGLYWESLGGGIDALAISRRDPPLGPIGLEDLLLSTEQAVGQAIPSLKLDHKGALDGSIFRLRRMPDGSGPRFEIFLPEILVILAIGQQFDWEADVDIDAFAQDEDGTLFISFREDEYVNGVLLEDDGVIAIPAEAITYDWDGNVESIHPFSAVIVLDKAAVDDLVRNAGLRLATGMNIYTLTDLHSLEIDPAGGTFTPVEPIPGRPAGSPHLLFGGQRLGATILTTRDGGRIADLNGALLGSPVVHGGGLGLHPESSQLMSQHPSGLCIAPRQEPSLVTDVLHGEARPILGGPPPTFFLGNFQPGGWAWLHLGAFYLGLGGGISSVPVGPPSLQPHLYLPQPWVTLPLPIDAAGRARLEVPVTQPQANMWLVLQAWEIGTGQLSPPAAVWVWK